MYTERSLGTYVSTYVCAHVWMNACARSTHSSVRVGACLCMRKRARGARQGHPVHEGEGAPRVARPVQALTVSVRPAPPRRRARWRRCRRCAAARALPRRALGRTMRRWMRRRWRCRSSASAEPRARMAGARVRQVRVRGGPKAARRALRGVPEPHGAAARLARRDAGGTELAALPAAADWPKLKYL
jgi:hypothetical protein